MARHVTATFRVRTMSGCSRSQLLVACNDLYITKLCLDRPSKRLAINELFAASLAQLLGIPFPPCALVHVPLELSHGLEFPSHLAGGHVAPCHFGSLHLVSCGFNHIFDYVPRLQEVEISNRADFAGAYIFDKWLGNTDRRQYVIGRRGRERAYRTVFIDNGLCFDGERWQFIDSSLAGQTRWGPNIWEDPTAYPQLNGWIERVEGMAPSAIWGCTEDVPSAWLDGDEFAFIQLVQRLIRRVSKLRGLVREGVAALREFHSARSRPAIEVVPSRPEIVQRLVG